LHTTIWFAGGVLVPLLVAACLVAALRLISQGHGRLPTDQRGHVRLRAYSRWVEVRLQPGGNQPDGPTRLPRTGYGQLLVGATALHWQADDGLTHSFRLELLTLAEPASRSLHSGRPDAADAGGETVTEPGRLAPDLVLIGPGLRWQLRIGDGRELTDSRQLARERRLARKLELLLRQSGLAIAPTSAAGSPDPATPPDSAQQ
jgi:hypothetical protein